ncbi:hypothetical protein ZIOFF_023127 [Zingiber officinale]|uniref:Cysteine proteinase inhibitor n=1 Tax=Zingiber officinale TaxID=94328 RepID=A0A8J5HAQ6_ZINOF|nr:hypothetical protein ZIOFF_023127 [Zingiber officinale]
MIDAIPPFEEHTGLPVGDPLHDPTVHVERVLGVLLIGTRGLSRKGEARGASASPAPATPRCSPRPRPCLCLGRRGVPLDENFEALFAAWEASGEAEELLFESVFVHADGRRRGRSGWGGERRRRRLFHGGPLELVADASLAVAEAATTHGLREVELGGGGESESGAGQRGGLLEEGGVAREKARLTYIVARFAVDEHNKKQNALLEFACVVKAREQVVAGTLHHLTVAAVEGGEKKLYEAKVWVKPWLNFKQVEEFKHVGEQGKSSVTLLNAFLVFLYTVEVKNTVNMKMVYANCIIRILDEPSDSISLIPKDAEKSLVVIFAHQRLEE